MKGDVFRYAYSLGTKYEDETSWKLEPRIDSDNFLLRRDDLNWAFFFVLIFFF